MIEVVLDKHQPPNPFAGLIQVYTLALALGTVAMK
jgi:hypothetical protein